MLCDIMNQICIMEKGTVMDEGSIQVYYGKGRGKTTAVLGLGIRVAGSGKTAIMVQFLRCKHSETLEFLKKLEPELQVFRFESGMDDYTNLPEEKRREQVMNIRMGLSYARKVMDTAQCDLLILDGVFGLVELGIISEEELVELVHRKDDSMDLILTGRILPDSIRQMADSIYCITTEREKKRGILDPRSSADL